MADPFNFDEYFYSKSPADQEQLNQIVMHYFNVNRDLDDPVESNDHLEVIADEYDRMKRGEDTKFIQHMNEGPAELGRLHPDDLPRGFGIPIKYDPDDREDLEMKYTSSDAFEIAFDHIAKANEGGRPMDNRLAPQWMRSEEPVEIEEDLPEVRVNENPPQGSACCEDLIAEVLGLIKRYPTSLLVGETDVEIVSCEDAVSFLDSQLSYGKYLLEDGDYWDGIGEDARSEWMASEQAQFESKILAEMREIKEQYEMCKGTEGSLGDDDMGFYASADPFEIAWDILIKRQTELGEHHPDAPSSQGPVVAFHGRNNSIRHNVKLKEGQSGWRDRLREEFDGDHEAMREQVDREKNAQVMRDGLVPNDEPLAQIGSGRWTEDPGGLNGKWNREIPANVSVASDFETARTYAEGRSGHKDTTGNPQFYGVRAGALENQLPMDEPKRRYGDLDTQPEKGNEYSTNRYRFIEGGVKPNQLTNIPFNDAETYSTGDSGPWSKYKDGVEVPPNSPSPYKTHGPDKAWKENYTDKFDHDDLEGSWARGADAGRASNQWIEDSVTEWRNKKTNREEGLARRKDLAEQDRQREESVPQQKLF